MDEKNDSLRIDLEKVIRDKNPRLAKTLPRFVIAYLKRIIHQDEINRILTAYAHLDSIPFIRAAFVDMGISYQAVGIERLADDGRYLFVSNHPFGGMDGLMLCDEIYSEYRRKHPHVPSVTISCADTPYWQQRAGTGLAASGTVTVESAIAGLPLVVGYKLNWVTILLASLVVRLYRGYFTMVNIIANRTIYEEFLQHHFSPKELVPAVERILPGGERRAEVEAGMEEVRKLLTPKSSSAARQAALACYDL